jgi:hypothetical protein
VALRTLQPAASSQRLGSRAPRTRTKRERWCGMRPNLRCEASVRRPLDLLRYLRRYV